MADKSNIRKGWRGIWYEFPEEFDLFGEGMGDTVSFPSNGAATSAMDGAVLDNRGATAAISITLPPAIRDMSFFINRYEYFPISLLPDAGGDTIRGGNGTAVMISSFGMFISCVNTGEWEVVLRDGDDLVADVRGQGAIGNGIVDDTDAFKRAYALLGNPVQTVMVPATSSSYIISDDFFESIPPTFDDIYTSRSQLGTTLLFGTITTSVQLKIPHQHKVRGPGRRVATNTTRGSIRTAATFPNDGTALIRMGVVPNDIVHGIVLEDVQLQCHASVTNGRAIEGFGLQEQCAVRGVITQGFNEGCILGYGTAGTVDGRNSNMMVEDCEFYLRTNASGYAFYLYNSSGTTTVRRCTGNGGTGTTTGFATKVFGLAGNSIIAEALHGEFCAAVVELGGVVLDIDGAEVSGLRTHGIDVKQVTATHPVTIDPCPRQVWIRSHAKNIIRSARISNVLGNSLETSNTTALIEDEGDAANGRPAITLDTATYGDVNSFEILYAPANSYTGAATVTSAHKGMRAITLAAAATRNDNLPPTFASHIRATADATGSVLTGLTSGYVGREITIAHVAGAGTIVLKHNDSNSTAGNRIWCGTLADITIQPFQSVILRWGFGPATSPTTGTWLATLL